VSAIVIGSSSKSSTEGSDLRIFLEESTRPPQRLARFSVGVDVDVEADAGVVAVALVFDKNARSRTRSARQLVPVVRPTTFPVTLTNEPETGTLTFSQRLLF
jgi:hypothetical protein